MISTLVRQCKKWCYDAYWPLGGTDLIKQGIEGKLSCIK